MIQILFGLRSMLGLDRKNDDFYANLFLIKKITYNVFALIRQTKLLYRDRVELLVTVFIIY